MWAARGRALALLLVAAAAAAAAEAAAQRSADNASAPAIHLLQSAATTPPPKATTVIPRMLQKPPKLDRAHKNKLLIEAPCENFCTSLIWQLKSPLDRQWRSADAEPHSNFPDTFYIRGLRPDTLYSLRALVRPRAGTLTYDAEDVPILEARTCPERPPPVSDLHVFSAGPGWLEVRWTPPPKETCRSHVFFQARYAPHGTYFSAWRTYGYFRSDRWVHFRPTHPCAPWPQEFCLLLTDGVRAGEQHVVEVRVSRFDELTPALSDSRKVAARADAECLSNGSCVAIGSSPATAAAPTDASATDPAASAPAPTGATDDVDVDDSDLPTTTAAALTQEPPRGNGSQGPWPCWPPSAPPSGGKEASGEASARSGGAPREVTGDSALGRAAPLLLALLLLACAAAPAAFVFGKRRGAREAVELHRVPAWRRRCGGDGGSEPVLTEDGGDEDDDGTKGIASGATLQMDQEGHYSWTKLLTRDS